MYGFRRLEARQTISWKKFFAHDKLGYHSGDGVFGHRPQRVNEVELPKELYARRNENCAATRLVEAYRRYGHLRATIDNVEYRDINRDIPELKLARYALGPRDAVDGAVLYGGAGRPAASELVTRLEEIYCGNISYEFTYLESETEREWFAKRVESGSDVIDKDRRIEIAKELLHSQAWDKFLSVKFPTVKRYCGEGAESLLTFFSTLFRLTTSAEVQYMVLGMAHRGKLNLLSGLLGCPPVKIFHKISGNPEFPEEADSVCDISTHLSSSTDISINGKSVKVTLLNNPSHLEAINPVSMGKTRSKQMYLKEGDYSPDGSSRMGDKILNVQIHGDAAFTGQGVNQETLMLTQAPHFHVGGSIHVVVNNQVGFTLPASRGRSSRYVTDLAKAIAVPVIHVNGDHPELVVKATNIAFEYQRTFRQDVFIDYNCFRRLGHNELDDPTFTNPLLYDKIHSRKSIPDVYAERLQKEGVLTEENTNGIMADYTKYLQSHFNTISTYKPEKTYFDEQWSKMSPAPNAIETWDTGVDMNLLKLVAVKSVQVPPDFHLHPHLDKVHVKNRLVRVSEEKLLDWATAEILAIGSLLMEGRHVRLSGEDVGRGTFSHRHVMLVDQSTEAIHIPLNHMHEEQKGFFEVANSILSEEAVLGFEYGMASDSPDTLCIWEAQFGDFYNGAQIMVDAFITSGEAKWVRSNGLVMLLPHGYDGAASEHSSCRLERFLQLTDSKESAPDSERVCLHVANPTTPAQYFHLLRRQMVRNYRKPLLVVAPKLLLRMAEAASPLSDFAPGTHFRPVIVLTDTLEPYYGKDTEESVNEENPFLKDEKKKPQYVKIPEPKYENATTKVIDPSTSNEENENHSRKRTVFAMLENGPDENSCLQPKRKNKDTFSTPTRDSLADPLKVKRVIIVSGKHYYELHKERVRGRLDDVAILRLEALTPFPLTALQQELDKYKNARLYIWSQEEHRNMGAWSFVKPRFENLLAKKLIYSGRGEAATPAVGAATLHRVEVDHILKDPLYNIK